MRIAGELLEGKAIMILRALLVLVAGSLIGCGSQSSLMNVRDMTDQNLVEYYQGIEADMEITRKELEEYSKKGRVIPSAMKQDQLNSLKKRKSAVELEFIRRGLRIPKKDAAN